MPRQNSSMPSYLDASHCSTCSCVNSALGDPGGRDASYPSILRTWQSSRVCALEAGILTPSEAVAIEAALECWSKSNAHHLAVLQPIVTAVDAAVRRLET